MLEDAFNDVYDKFKINFYRNIFSGFETRETSLTTLETFCLEVIYVLNNPTLNELATFLNISQPNMAYKIASLVKKGYVIKIQSESDKREFHLSLTDKFYKYYNIKNDYIKLVLSRLKNTYSEDELKKFEQMLTIVSTELMPEVTQFIKNKDMNTLD